MQKKYDVLGVVGEGAYGIVYKCRNKETGIKNTYTYTVQYLLHEDTEYPKVCNLYDGNLYAASSVVNMQSTKVSKINNEGKPIYGNATINVGYTPDANLIQPYNMDYYILTHHNKQNLQGQRRKENRKIKII